MLVFAFAVPAAQMQDNEAEKLFRMMQDKVRSAKSLKVTFEAKAPRERPKRGQLQLTIYISSPDKIRCDGQLVAKGAEVGSAWVICNGATVVCHTEHGEETTYPAPENAVATCKDMLADCPGLMIFDALIFRELPKLAKAFVLSDFIIGPKEKIGGRDAQVILYTTKIEDDKSSAIVKCKVWIDIQTHLPLKRTFGSMKDDCFEEFYQDWQLNPKLDPKLFELPK
jgi:outer membrane lipoprotein-sorting protein